MQIKYIHRNKINVSQRSHSNNNHYEILSFFHLSTWSITTKIDWTLDWTLSILTFCTVTKYFLILSYKCFFLRRNIIIYSHFPRGIRHFVPRSKVNEPRRIKKKKKKSKNQPENLSNLIYLIFYKVIFNVFWCIKECIKLAIYVCIYIYRTIFFNIPF